MQGHPSEQERDAFLAREDGREYVRRLVAERGWTEEIEREGMARFEALIAGELRRTLDRNFIHA